MGSSVDGRNKTQNLTSESIYLRMWGSFHMCRICLITERRKQLLFVRILYVCFCMWVSFHMKGNPISRLSIDFQRLAVCFQFVNYFLSTVGILFSLNFIWIKEIPFLLDVLHFRRDNFPGNRTPFPCLFFYSSVFD